MARQPKRFSSTWWRTRCKYIVEKRLPNQYQPITLRECLNKKGPDGGYCYRHAGKEDS